MVLTVMKFGGTSVGSAERIRKSATIVRDAASTRSIVVVVSAVAGVTDLILQAVNAAQHEENAQLAAHLETVESVHERAVEQLFDGDVRRQVWEEITPELRRLRQFCSALNMLRSSTPQILDVALPIGERLSARIFAAMLRKLGAQGEFVDSSAVIVTDDHFGDAAADMELTAAKCRQSLAPILEAGRIPVVMGFSGASPEGRPTTLGRGGSDSSATIIGAAMRSHEVWIWTDVDGVMTADPRTCPDASILPEITYAEAIELSYYGAKVIHHKAVRPAADAGIPVWIKNSFRPEIAGTRIGAASLSAPDRVKAVSVVKHAALITLTTRHDTHFAEIFGRLLLRLGHEHVDMLFSTQSSSENSLGLVLRAGDCGRIVGAIDKLFRVELKHGVLKPVLVRNDISVIAVLGESMRGMSGTIGRLFSAVARSGESVIAVAQGASEINICFAVKNSGADKVVRAVHAEFFGTPAQASSAGETQ